MKQNHSHLPNTDAAGDRKIQHYDTGTSTAQWQRRFTPHDQGCLLERSSGVAAEEEEDLLLQWHKKD
jgi:hypothetical protein